MKAAHITAPKVLYVITKASWGGAQRYVWDLMQRACASGYTPVLIFGESGLLQQRAVAEGFSTYHVAGLTRDISLSNDLRALRSLYRIFATLRPVSVHLNSSKASFIGALAARLAGIHSIIFTAHGWAFTENRSALSRSFFAILHYGTVLLSTTTITVSEAISEATKKWPFVQTKIVCIRHGVPLTGYFSKEEAREKLSAAYPELAAYRETPWVMTIAELHPNKDIETGIKAWKQLGKTTAHWLIIGAGEKEAELREQAEGSTTIHFLGFLADASTFIGASDIFFLPSQTEALGYVLLEAGAASVATIATNVGGIPEIISDGKTGLLVSPGDYSAMAEALRTLIENDALRAELGQHLHTHIRTSFSQEEMFSRTFALYPPL